LDTRIPYARATILIHLGRENAAKTLLRQILASHPDATACRQLLDKLMLND